VFTSWSEAATEDVLSLADVDEPEIVVSVPTTVTARADEHR
jgi:hypothetical protein